jgi:putative transposase
VVKRLLESYMEEELLKQLRAGRWRRTELRRGYRNGYRQRSLPTESGLVEHLRIPRDREGYYRLCVIEGYQRRREKVNQLIRECLLAGVGTRRAGEVLALILGQAPSLRSFRSQRTKRGKRGFVDRYCADPFEHLKRQLPDIDDNIRFAISILLDKVSTPRA